MWLYRITSPEGDHETTWATDEEAAWDKFCTAFHQPPGDGRHFFIIMAKRSGHTCERFQVPDEVVGEALMKEKLAGKAVARHLFDLVTLAKAAVETYDRTPENEAIVKNAKDAILKLMGVPEWGAFRL